MAEVIEENKTLTIEELEAKLKEYEEKNKEYEAQNKNLKATLSERNSENASKKREIEEWKEKYNSTLSEAQLAEQKRVEEAENTKRELAELKRKSAIADYKAMYLSMGYSEELAQSSAEAKADGNDALVFANEKSHLDQREKEIKAEMLKGQPSITPGSPLSAEDAEKVADANLRRYFGL